MKIIAIDKVDYRNKKVVGTYDNISNRSPRAVHTAADNIRSKFNTGIS